MTIDELPIQARLRLEHAGRWVAWAADDQSVLAVADTHGEVRDAARRAGVPRAVCEWIPPMPRSRPTFDERGRILPRSDEEARRRAAETIEALDHLASMGDDEEQVETFAALVEAIDRDRTSDRRRFAE